MKRKLTISDLDGFEDICNEKRYSLVAGDIACNPTADERTWWEVVQDEQLEKYMGSHGPNSSSK